MKQIFLAFLFLGLASVTIPPLRARTQPHLDRMGDFLGGKLEGPLSPVLNPYRRLRSESEMGEMTRELVRDRNSGFLRPDPDDFQEYLQTRLEGEDGRDLWGTPYVLVPEADSLAIMSAGPDLEYETEDDVIVKIRFGTPAYMPRRRF